MPRKRRVTRRSSKKPRRSVRAPRRDTLQKDMVAFGNGFPKACKVTHTYIDAISMTCTAGIPAVYRYSANGLYDPNITSTGTQPMYFDQFTALYDQYVVIASKVQFKIIPSTASQPPILCSVLLNDDTVQASSDPNIIAQGPQGAKLIIPAGANNAYTLTRSFSAKKMFKGSVMANTELQGTVSTNPTEQSYYDLNMRSLDASANCSILVETTITYIAIWKELKDIAGS